MRVLYRLLIFVAAFSMMGEVYGQTFNWVKGGGSTEDLSSETSEAAYSMCADAHNNIYTLSVIGTFAITADTFLRPTGAYGAPGNILLTSYNCTGQMRWAKLIGSSGGQCIPYSVACDGLGHIYVGGYVTNGTLHIGYDASIAGSLYQNEALMQFDTSGVYNWIQYVGDNTVSTHAGALNYGSFLAVDGSNNIHFINSMKYGVHITPTITSHWGTYDLMYSTSGSLLTVNRLELDSSLQVNGGTIDKQSNKVYVYGYRSALFPDSSQYAYIGAFGTSGNLIWKDTLSNPYYPTAKGFGDVVADGLGNLYVIAVGARCFVYKGDTTYNTISTGSQNVSGILRLDTAGNLNWVRSFSGNIGGTALSSLTLIPNHKIAACGTTSGSMVSGSHSLFTISSEGYNPFFTIVDSGGYLHTIQQLHGSGFYDNGNVVRVDNVGNLYLGGRVGLNIFAGALTPYTSIGGDSDYFIMKYGVDCGCTSMPIANYTQTGSITRNFNYTGTATTFIDSMRWNFGDGGTSTLTSPTHTYSTPGTFTACVTAYTSCGSDMHCDTFSIICVAAPSSSYSTSGTGLTKSFTYTGSTSTGLGMVSWTYGDGGTGTGLFGAHAYAAAGVYTVCVTATNPCGSNTYCGTINVTCATTPMSNYSVSGSDLSKSFTYTGTTASLDSVTWDFGDGGVATGLAPVHLYSAAGTYTVCATLHAHVCGGSIYCNTVVATCATPPVASYSQTGTSLVRNFTYTGVTSGIDSVKWIFGDGNTAIGNTATHTFATSDTYHVCVIVYSNCGTDTSCTEMIVTGIATLTGPSLSAIIVYPNPAKSEMNITNVPELSGYRLLAITGTTIMEGTLQQGSNALLLPGYAPGVYILELTGGDGAKRMVRVVKE